jgi:hypothetical protein
MLILPDSDIWIRAFSRTDPDPGVVHAIGQLLPRRRLLLAGPVCQEVLARTRNDRQMARLAWILAAFPTLGIAADDYLAAADLAVRLPQRPSHQQALLWTVAQRHGVGIWSLDPAWQPLAAHGCPVRRSWA